MNAILRSMTQAEQKVVAAVYRAHSHLLSDRYHSSNYPEQDWNPISIKKNRSSDKSPENLRRAPEWPRKNCCCWGEPGVEERNTLRLTLCSLGRQAHVQWPNSCPDNLRRGHSHHWGYSTQQTPPADALPTAREPTESFPQLTSVGLLHAKPN